ncbi:hypothetical protein [Coralliovum pocilloporae]|uniref:hypothetical protein n=1 Tax=Coralliovum pocilloporae TaxID=3066369 RepID=UPI003307504E
MSKFINSQKNAHFLRVFCGAKKPQNFLKKLVDWFCLWSYNAAHGRRRCRRTAVLFALDLGFSGAVVLRKLAGFGWFCSLTI